MRRRRTVQHRHGREATVDAGGIARRRERATQGEPFAVEVLEQAVGDARGALRGAAARQAARSASRRSRCAARPASAASRAIRSRWPARSAVATATAPRPAVRAAVTAASQRASASGHGASSPSPPGVSVGVEHRRAIAVRRARGQRRLARTGRAADDHEVAGGIAQHARAVVTREPRAPARDEHPSPGAVAARPGHPRQQLLRRDLLGAQRHRAGTPVGREVVVVALEPARRSPSCAANACSSSNRRPSAMWHQLVNGSATPGYSRSSSTRIAIGGEVWRSRAPADPAVTVRWRWREAARASVRALTTSIDAPDPRRSMNNR